MCVDYGKARLGIAFSDPSATLASAYEVWQSKGEEEDLKHLIKLATERKVKSIVFGLPLNADGSESDFARVTKNFAEKLSQMSNIEVCFEDERFTSLDAEEILKQRGLGWKERKAVLDKYCAEIILQNYLNKLKRR